MAKILVIEDDRSLNEALAYNLRREGHVPVIAENARLAVDLARNERFDLVLLDLMLPGGSGFDVCRTIRSFSSAPIIILTARDEEVDRVLGLEIGADDYVTKPYRVRELLARINANLRRVDMDVRGSKAEQLVWKSLQLDITQRRVLVDDQLVTLQPTEFDLLAYLMRNPGVVLRRDDLLHAVWGHDYVGERTVDVHVRRVRAKLEVGGITGAIRTIHGVGYAFASDDDGASLEPTD